MADESFKTTPITLQCEKKTRLPLLGALVKKSNICLYSS